MRDRKHYLEMLRKNPSATIGYTLAAKMVAAFLYGDADIVSDTTLRDISRRLRAKYGETLNHDEVRAEIGASV